MRYRLIHGITIRHLLPVVAIVSAVCVSSHKVLAQAPPSPLKANTINNAGSFSYQKVNKPINQSLRNHSERERLLELNASLNNLDETYHLYSEKDFDMLWAPVYRQGNPVQELVAYLKDIHTQGLSAQDYHLQMLDERCLIPDTKVVEDCDILQTDAIIGLTHDLQSGKINPNKLFEKTEVIKSERDFLLSIERALIAPTLKSYFESIEPSSNEYQSMKYYLKDLSQRQIPAWEPLALKPSIKPAMVDSRLSPIIERLVFWQDVSPDWLEKAPFGLVYEGELIKAVERFQLRHGLEVDGVIGKKTIAALNITPQERVKQLAANLERIRWYGAEQYERLIKVNIPSYELWALEGGELHLRKAVIVGEVERPTPIFEDKIQYLVLNPTWVVPWELARKDKLPLIQENPRYLLDNQFSVYLQDFKINDPNDIDWRKVTKNEFPYRLVQAAGAHNALGQVKFMFPNPYEVYLHDTPAKSLFNNDLRAFSSGCIRVQDPMDLVWWILRADGLNDIDIKKQLNKKYTNTVYLASAVPIRLEYRTAYLGQDNTIQFRADIYQRDKKLYEALQQPVASTHLH
ncbi:L,D-transpeptidase family protein [Kangiella sediminilitoris]|uniref:ErfK/YbiS/YcfS/YnhG family protein n=1 Tax=Kangiella sediminilitoris TaxID=1144748 RepID=A0A1B3B7M7_9GAMM|nr:L,D-transpeptidase family protein [Kangiella sediminilitoris]AOE48786.1 ErfK/YbiS/YcfS/YnhG family protein [Kangiella sediminilitoris]